MSEAIEILRSIDDGIKALLAMVRPLVAAAPKPVASDRDLDSTYGNPEVRFMPRDWTGPAYVGRRFSECPPDMLDMLASTFDYFAGKDEAENKTTAKGKPSAPFKRADAARARGWAARLRGGWQTPPAASTGTNGHAWASGADEPDHDPGF